MSKFYSALFVSATCFGPHQSIIRSVLYKLYLQTLVYGTTVRTTRYIQPLHWLDVSSSTRITTWHSLQIQLVRNAPDDGPMRSETCRANKKCWINLLIKTTLCVLLDYIYILQDDTRSLQCQDNCSSIAFHLWHTFNVMYLLYNHHARTRHCLICNNVCQDARDFTPRVKKIYFWVQDHYSIKSATTLKDETTLVRKHTATLNTLGAHVMQLHRSSQWLLYRAEHNGRELCSMWCVMYTPWAEICLWFICS